MCGDERLAFPTICVQPFLLVGSEMRCGRRDEFQRKERRLSGCLNTVRLGLDSLSWLSVNNGCLSGQPVADNSGNSPLSGVAGRAEHGENLRP